MYESCAAPGVSRPVRFDRLERESADVRFAGATDPMVLRSSPAAPHWLPADRTIRWQAWLTDDEPAELVFYCPVCAEGEFGND